MSATPTQAAHLRDEARRKVEASRDRVVKSMRLMIMQGLDPAEYTLVQVGQTAQPKKVSRATCYRHRERWTWPVLERDLTPGERDQLEKIRARTEDEGPHEIVERCLALGMSAPADYAPVVDHLERAMLSYPEQAISPSRPSGAGMPFFIPLLRYMDWSAQRVAIEVEAARSRRVGPPEPGRPLPSDADWSAIAAVAATAMETHTEVLERAFAGDQSLITAYLEAGVGQVSLYSVRDIICGWLFALGRSAPPFDVPEWLAEVGLPAGFDCVEIRTALVRGLVEQRAYERLIAGRTDPEVDHRTRSAIIRHLRFGGQEDAELMARVWLLLSEDAALSGDEGLLDPEPRAATIGRLRARDAGRLLAQHWADPNSQVGFAVALDRRKPADLGWLDEAVATVLDPDPELNLADLAELPVAAVDLVISARLAGGPDRRASAHVWLERLALLMRSDGWRLLRPSQQAGLTRLMSRLRLERMSVVGSIGERAPGDPRSTAEFASDLGAMAISVAGVAEVLARGAVIEWREVAALRDLHEQTGRALQLVYGGELVDRVPAVSPDHERVLVPPGCLPVGAPSWSIPDATPATAYAHHGALI